MTKSFSAPHKPANRHKNPKSGHNGGQAPEKNSSTFVRQLACAVFCDILKNQITLPEAFQNTSFKASSPSDTSHLLPQITAIVSATFRHLNTLHSLLKLYLTNGFPKNNRVMGILLTGAAQITLLDKPAHAVINDSVKIAKAHPKTAHASGLINAVLRKVAQNSSLPCHDPLIDIPPMLRERWISQYGQETTEKFGQIFHCPPYVDISLKNSDSQSVSEEWAAKLDGFLLPTGSIRLKHKKPVSELPGYTEGAWWVQDVSSALPVKMLAPSQGENILDLCAAPGGKTAQIAASGAHVTAVDISEKRLERLQQNMKRLQLEVEVISQDILSLPAKEYDGVVLDAPCSATGTIRRHPEAAWIKTLKDIQNLAKLQTILLDKTAQLVKPGGHLVYCTCSLEYEEGEEQINSFLKRHPDFERNRQRVKNLGLPELENDQGDMRALPFYLNNEENNALSGMDGFFASCLRRKHT